MKKTGDNLGKRDFHWESRRDAKVETERGDCSAAACRRWRGPNKKEQEGEEES